VTFAQPFKDYEILERIGSGAMGTVFKARQKRLNRIVALKVLKPSLARNTNFVERQRREARIVASLNHPDIVAGYDLGEEGGYHFFVMEFVEGTSLATLLKEWGAFPEERVLDVGIRVASALDHAFKKGVIHRDVKPGNILIDKDGRAKLTDLGLAKAPEDVTITQEGATVGTPQYISPEQARDPSKVDIRSDLYSLGATLFHMATGQPPFVGDTLAAVIHGVVHARPPLAHSINPALSESLSAVIRKLLAKRPSLRYQTPAELLADLQRVRRAEAPEVDLDALAAAEQEPATDGVRWGRVAVAVAIVLCLGGGATWWALRSPATSGASDAPALLVRTRDALTTASGWRGKLRVLQQAAADAATQEERQAVAELRAGVVDPWQRDVERFGRERRERAAEFVVLVEHWRDPARALRTQIVEALERTFQVHRAELPEALRQVLENELTRVDSEVGAKVAERDQNLQSAYRAHLSEDDARRWRAALTAGDFVAAERAARAPGQGFFGESGRPRREQLSAAGASEVAKLDAEATAVALAEIERVEARTSADLLRTVEQAYAGFREFLRVQSDPRLLAAQAHGWRKGLDARYPAASAFRSGQDPWPRVRDADVVFNHEMQTALAVADQARLAGDVHLALSALLLDGDAAREVEWLGQRQFEATAIATQRDQFVAWLNAAHAARDWLLESLATKLGGKAATIDDPGSPGRSLQVAVRREAGRLELVERDGARVRRVPLARLLLSDLLALAAPPPADDNIDRGLALWLYCAGETRAGGERVPATARAFFGEHLAPALQAALAQRHGDESEARVALASLQGAKASGGEALLVALEAFEQRFGRTAAARANLQFLVDLRAQVRSVQQRQATLANLRAAVGRGLRAELGDDARALVTFDVSGAAELSLPSGWAIRDDRVAFAGVDVALETTRAQALVLDDALATEQGVAVACEVVFGPQGRRPRLYLLELHGVGVALGLNAAGEPLAAVVPVDDLARDRALQRALEPLLEDLVERKRELPVVVPGARHSLVVRVRVQTERLAATVRLDDVEIGAGVVPKLPRVAPRLVLMPMQPLALLRAQIDGQYP
jgi:tRNA A-37 threonylcarbamoyl transferase component Bud32